MEKLAFPTKVAPFLRSAVDIGEAAVIQIALDRGIRRVARASGLSVTGSLGILLKAKAAGYPLSLCGAISRMRVRGIWLADAVAAEAIRLAGE